MQDDTEQHFRQELSENQHYNGHNKCTDEKEPTVRFKDRSDHWLQQTCHEEGEDNEGDIIAHKHGPEKSLWLVIKLRQNTPLT